MRLGRLSLVVAASVAGLIGAALVPAAASGSLAPSGAAAPTAGLIVMRADTPPPIPRGAARLGAVAGSAVLHLDVTLRVRNPSALTSFIAALSDRQSPLFHHFLRRGQFGARFGPTKAQVAVVDAALRSRGLSPGPVTAGRLAIPVTATAATAGRAFGVSLDRYRLPGGRVAYANSAAPRLPAAAARYVQGVLGLSDLYLPRSLAARPVRPVGRRHGSVSRMTAVPSAGGPRPCAAARNAATPTGPFTANQLASYYAMSPLYGLGDLGGGVHVALAEFEPDSTSDINAYRSCYGVHTSVRYIKVDGGVGSGTGAGEAALDIEDVIGLAPGVSIDVYQEPNGGDTDTYDLYSAIVKDDADQVVSTSWGACELDSDSSLISSEHTLFAMAATQGQTVFAAAGDSGSTACYGDGSSNGGNLSADDPASQPYVVGVGGTSIGATSENVWNNSSISNGAGGGGLSVDWCMPSYQDKTAIPGLISSYSRTAGSCGTKVPYVRQVPDVSADADPYTGYVIDYSGSWQAFGGTSAAAPLWAAVAALTDASPFCSDYGSGAAGVRPEGLYKMVGADHSYIYTGGEALYDVTSGNNDYTPSGYSGGLYPATRGYDMASGLGTPLATGFGAAGKPSMFYPGLTALMCWQYRTKLRTTTITGINPRLGPSAKPRTITITGTGFLPVRGADMAEIGSRQFAATCHSTRRCTVRLPPMHPGTVAVRISAEDLTLSRITAATHYRFVATPKITSLSPASGRSRGGNTVTIHGSNFIDVTSVHFGHNRAAHVKVISPTKITVTAPSGSGTVTVTVTGAGGTSAPTHASRYRYR